MSRRVIRLAAHVVLLALISAPVRAQSLEHVQWAVERCLGMDEEHDQARQALRAWGNDALVHLAALADVPGADANYGLMSAIARIDTAAGYGLLFELLEHREPNSTVPMNLPYLVLAEKVLAVTARPPASEVIPASPVFRDATIQQASGVKLDVHGQSLAIQVIAKLGWDDQLPLLHDLLAHPSHHVRGEVIEAIESLTGESLQLDDNPADFPGAREVPDLFVRLALPELELPYDPSVAFVDWDRGERAPIQGLVVGTERGDPTVLGLEDGRVTASPADGIRDVDKGLVMPRADGRGEQLAVLTQRRLISLKSNGSTLWKARRFYADSWSSLHPLWIDGAIGGVLVVDTQLGRSVDAFDLEGAPLWDRAGTFGLRQVDTTPAAGGLVLLVNDDVELLDARGESLDEPGGPVRNALNRLRDQLVSGVTRPRAGAFVANPNGGWNVALAGRGGDWDNPVLALVDSDGQQVWRASLLHDVTHLDVLEPRDGPPLIICITEDARLLAVTHDGTLVWRTRLPGEHPASRSTDGLVTGLLGEDAVIAVTTMKQIHLYRLTRTTAGL